MKTIELTQGKVAFVDDEDFEKLCKYRWYAQKGKSTYYVRQSYINEAGYQTNPSMHRQIVNCPDGMQVDHIDGNGLNNCKSNLRIVTPRQNSQNKHSTTNARYVGVWYNKQRKRWKAKIVINGKSKHLGSYNTAEEAHRGYVDFLKTINDTYVLNVLSEEAKSG